MRSGVDSEHFSIDFELSEPSTTSLDIIQTSRSINDISNSVAHFSPRNDFSEEMILAEK